MDDGLVGLLLLIPSALSATLPMLTFLALIWWLDRYDREPIWLLALTFLWGAIGGVLFGIMGSLTLMSPLPYLPLDAALSDAASTVIIAPLAEEPAKAAFLLVVMWNRNFDNMTDGFVYGAAAGLGFGMTENFMYFTSVAFGGDATAWVQTVIIRTLYSAVMHASASSIVGAALGFARFRGCFTLVLSGAGGLGLAMAVHMLWNGLITLDVLSGGSGKLQTANMIIFPFEVLLLFVVFQLCLFEESHTIHRELADEASRGLIPQHHPAILASWLRRHRRDWVPRGVDHTRYVQATTSLALRKHQARMAPGPQGEFYRDEVYRLRRQVGALLGRSKQRHLTRA